MMGSRKDPGLYHDKQRSGVALDDSGQLSIDFFIGLSIFLITLIIAATMISGLLVGLQTKTIDFDAVAYRTGVIIVEDPGEPSTGAIYETISKENQWEFIGYDQKDQIRRLGLTLYKSTPRVLSEEKVQSFFDRNQFPELSEYRDRIISGDYPYHFNISLKIIGGPSLPPIGDSFDPDSSYGYIRRVVLVKNQTQADIDMYPFSNNTVPGPDQFYVNITYRLLLNQTRGPQYWIEPPKEVIAVNLVNISAITNQSPNVKLTNIRLTFEGKLLDGREVSDINLPYEPFIVDIDNGTLKTFVWPDGAPGGPHIINESINITFPAGFFIPPSEFAIIREIKMRVRYEFTPGTVNLSDQNSYNYLPESPGFSPPHLIPAILEVRVW